MAIVPWQKVGQQRLLANGFGKALVSQRFRDPRTGSEDEYVLFGQPDWSVVLALTSDHHVIAVRQFKQGCDQITIELPAGTSSAHAENSLEVAKRELLEETGYAAGAVTQLGPAQFMSTRNSWTRFHVFLATDCVKTSDPTLDASEDVEVVMIPLADWVNLCHQDLVEPSAIVATFRALPRFGSVDEYKELGANLRFYGNMRFAQFTIFMAASGGLASLLYASARQWTRTEEIVGAIAGLLLSSAFWIMERRAAQYWHGFRRRAQLVGAALGYKEYAPERTGILTSSLAVNVLLAASFVYWLGNLITSISL